MPLEFPSSNLRHLKPSERLWKFHQPYEKAGNSFIYIARCKRFIKIGISQDPEKRIHSMASANPHTIELLATYVVPAQYALTTERNAMLALNDKHHHSEWFKCTKIEAMYAVQQALKKNPA